MGEFGQKSSIPDKDFMIHIHNNFPKEYDVILDGLENHLMARGNDALMIEVIRKIKPLVQKSQNKHEEKMKPKIP